MSKDKIVMYDSDEAARRVEDENVWESRHGYKFVSEHFARNNGCTHRKCINCGKVIEKSTYTCPECLKIERDIWYSNLIKEEWVGSTPVYSVTDGNYFYNMNELRDYCTEHECQPDDMRLLLCKPIRLRHIYKSYWIDNLPEDVEELPKEVVIAIDNLNTTIDASGTIGWKPCDKAAIVNLED